MNLNYSIPGECKEFKNKGWESVYLEGSATEIFSIRQRWTSFYRRNFEFSSQCGFQTMWIGRAERWLSPGNVSVDCHASPKHFQGIITLWFLSSHSLPESCSNQTAVPEGLWGGESFHAELTRCLVRQNPCPAGAQQRLWKQIPTSLQQLGYSSTDKALSSSRQQTSKEDVCQWLAAKRKREKISRDLENMTEETFMK